MVERSRWCCLMSSFRVLTRTQRRDWRAARRTETLSAREPWLAQVRRAVVVPQRARAVYVAGGRQDRAIRLLLSPAARSRHYLSFGGEARSQDFLRRSYGDRARRTETPSRCHGP